MINQVFNRVNDVRDLCEKRCEQLRHLSKPIYRPSQRVHPLPYQQNETFNLIGTTATILQQINEQFPSFEMDSNQSFANKMDKKQK